MMKKDEQTIRRLYKNIISNKLLKDSLDNKIRLLLIKEKEYEIIKDKTGAFFRNGEIVYNKQKDNEIIILRAENSNLKNIIENYENIITEKDLLYNSLKSKYNNALYKINKNKPKNLSIPNININLNDSSHLTNIDNNTFNYSTTLNKSEKPMNTSENRQCPQFNYLKFKNISKNKSIPYNYSLSFKNLFKNSLLDLSPKDIFGAKNKNTKSMSKINKKTKKICFENKNQNQNKNPKEICSLKKKKFKIDMVFRNQNNYNKNNLLRAYTSNSARNIKKSPAPPKISTFSNEAKISTFRCKNTHSKKKNLIKKINVASQKLIKKPKKYVSKIKIKIKIKTQKKYVL
jgi:hypothetical protein